MLTCQNIPMLRIYTGSDEGYVACPARVTSSYCLWANFIRYFDELLFYHLLIQLVIRLNILTLRISLYSVLSQTLNEFL